MFVYGVLGFLRPAIYIFLLPFYTNVFTPEENGIHYLMIDVAALALVIIGFRLSSAMLTYYYNYFNDKVEVKNYLRSSYSISVMLSVVILVILYFIGPSLFRFVFKSEEILFFPYGFTVCIYAALAEVNMIYFVYLRNEKELVKYSILVLTQTFSVIIMQILLICYFDMGVQGALLGMALGWVFVTIAVFIMEKNIFTFKPNWSMVKASLRFSITLIPYLVIYWLMLQGGKFFLERDEGITLGDVAVYAILMVLTRLIILGVEALINGIRPFLYEQFALKENGDAQQISMLTKMIINVPLLALPVAILVGTNMHIITSHPKYYEMSPYMTMGCLVIYIFVYVKLFYQQLLFAKKSVLVTILSFVALLFLIGGFVYFIPRFQIWGVLYATLIGNVVLSILFFIAAQKFLPIQYNFGSIFISPVITFACIFGLERLMLNMGYNLTTFGWVQLIVVTGVIFALNFNNVKDYKSLFMRNKIQEV